MYFPGTEQDAGLDALSSIISRQKQMGQEIGNELDEQNGKDKVSPRFSVNLGCGVSSPHTAAPPAHRAAAGTGGLCSSSADCAHSSPGFNVPPPAPGGCHSTWDVPPA